MDYDDIIKELGSFGKYQRRVFFLLSVPCLLTGFGASVTSFILGNHQHRCKLPFHENDTFAVQSETHLEIINKTIPRNPDGTFSKCSILINGTETKCSEWVYDQSQFKRTVTSDFNLVCDNLYLRSHVKIAYMVGFLMASVISQLADVVGRRFMVRMVCTLQIGIVFAIPFSSTLPMFATLRFFEGMFSLAFFQVYYTTVLELVGSKERIITVTLPDVFWSLGQFLMILLVYFERDWFYVMLFLALPTVYNLIFWIPGLLPESPRWLTARGRTEEASKILTKMAKVNKVQTKVDAYKIKQDSDPGMMIILKELLRSKILLRRLLIVISNWFTVSFIYYGLTLNVDSLGGNLYANYALLGLVELAGYCVIFFVNMTGRKPAHLVAIFGCGVASIGSILLILFAENTLHWLHILLALISRFGISVLFSVLYLYTGELFPTVVRSIVMGTVSIGARIGSMISPYLYDITDGKMGKMVPLIAYSVLTITVGLISIRLPETNKRKLMETVHDVSIENADLVKYYEDKDTSAEVLPLE
ncbi:organic cation transporter protein-like [Ostrea edulis]|uniref:organic cation transporter protein-like n=1 Tax=Ostrea edulis TaxID=37623 RepID=UPI0024AFD08C|nr:organic cation transporter protein-like [Ostrea edulis]